jgi:hypothetical protein
VVRESMEEALEASKVFEQGMINDIRLRSRIKWLEKWYAVTKLLLFLFKNQGLHTLILELETKIWGEASSQARLGEYCREFYSKFYIREACRHDLGKVHEVFLNNLSYKIFNQLNKLWLIL